MRYFTATSLMFQWKKNDSFKNMVAIAVSVVLRNERAMKALRFFRFRNAHPHKSDEQVTRRSWNIDMYGVKTRYTTYNDTSCVYIYCIPSFEVAPNGPTHFHT